MAQGRASSGGQSGALQEERVVVGGERLQICLAAQHPPPRFYLNVCLLGWGWGAMQMVGCRVPTPQASPRQPPTPTSPSPQPQHGRGVAFEKSKVQTGVDIW